MQASLNCSWRLPQTLVEYLGRLAAESAEAVQTFVLSVRHTGMGDVQDILIRRGNTSSWRTVFGYPPVEATVLASRAGDDIRLALEHGEKEQAPDFCGREAAACFA